MASPARPPRARGANVPRRPQSPLTIRGKLPRLERMRSRREFRETYEVGRAVHGLALVLFLLRRPGARRRVGFVAGRKIGGAVARNRARRCMREAYRGLRAALPDDLWLVWVARKGAEARGTAEIAREMQSLLDRAG